MGKFDKASSLGLLKAKAKELRANNEARLPRREDFTKEELVAIKAFLGPMPRALEEAGLKPPRSDDRKTLNSEKRIRAKRNRNEARKKRKTEV